MREQPRELVVMIVDVGGKGMAASLLTASLEALCAEPLEAGFPPHEVLSRVSARLLRRTPPEGFATAFLGAIDPTTGRLRFANAGHPPGLVIGGGGSHRWLRASGIPLGLLPSTRYDLGETVLAPGELLVLYTDGLSEAPSPDGEELGRDRLAEICRGAAEMPLPMIASVLDTKVAEHTGDAVLSDDRTLLLVRRSHRA
jgi:sigma-B regulation protein RsbU (phosphoserine phosphatase)